MEFNHIPVLLNETIEGLAVRENGIYVDGTAGGGGHSAEILRRLKSGRLISIDQDPDAIRTGSTAFCSTSAYPPISSTRPNAAFRSMRTRRSTCA